MGKREKANREPAMGKREKANREPYIGVRIRRFRIEKGLTQAQLANLIPNSG